MSTVESILGAMGDSISTRHIAAKVIAKVAEAGSAGHFPEDVTCEQLGEALERIMVNAPGDDPLTDLIRGYRDAEKRRRRY